MNKYFYIAIVFFLPKALFAQGEFNNWYFGDKAGVSFNSGVPVALTNSAAFSSCISITISDSLGNLLFYSNGNSVFNRLHGVMPNGSGLITNMTSFNQPVLAVQKLDDDSSYYLFTVDDVEPLFPYYGLNYSIINMRLDGGMGDIELPYKNIMVPGTKKASNVVTGTRHKNNHDAWVVVKLCDQDSNFYASYLIDMDGIDTIPVLSPSQKFHGPFFWLAPTEIKISQDGTKLLCSYGDTIEYCSFNTQTGEIESLFLFRTPEHNGSVTFGNSIELSIDTKVIYISCSSGILPDYTLLYQYDATKTDSTDFVNSAMLVGESNTKSALQLAPDNKIYGSVYIVDSLHVIKNPSIPGPGCGYQVNAISLNGKTCTHGLPQFIQRYYAYISYTGQCQGYPVSFSYNVWPEPDSVYWDFGDPGSGNSNTSSAFHPFHTYALPGSYTVMFIVKHIDNRYDTAYREVQIFQSPQPYLGPDVIICQGDSTTFNAGFCTNCTYLWTDLPTGLPVGIGQTFTTSLAGLYEVAVTAQNGCIGRDTVLLTVTPPPVVTNSPLAKSICSGEPTNIPLTSNIPGTNFTWNAEGSSPQVSGYTSGSSDIINQILTNSGSDPENVTYTITPAFGNCEGDSVQFIVTVTPGDSVQVAITASTDSICEGTPITYTATPTHGGSVPVYQWIVNGINQGTNNSVFNYTPSNDDTVCCILTSSDTVCISNNPATSNEILVTVYPDLPVNISISTANNPVCEGSTATFAASTSNKGASPNFQWVVNGNPVGTNDSIFTYTPSNGYQVYCILTSSEQCTSNNPATSDTTTMIVNPLLPVEISISASANPVCEGLPITYTSTSVNGGANPTYQWQVNGINTGTNNPGFTYTPGDGDLVTCTLTSNAECVTNNPVTSNSISMSVGEAPDVSFTVCFDTITTLTAKPFKLKGGVPLGGIYSGPGVNQITGYFNPAMAGVGLKIISYSYTNQYTCSNNATRAISVINQAPFSCGDSLTDIRDNKKYPTIHIGSQCWLAVNLNHGQQIGGSSTQRDNCLVEKYCYNDLPASCTQYGALYQWDELMRYEDYEEIQGLCPSGWHVPSEADWNQLFAVYQGNAFAGSPLLYTGYSGFNVLLAGVEFFNQSNRFVDFASIMWSSTSHGPYKAWSHGLNEYNYSVSYYPSYRSNAFSVRCVRD